MATTIKTKNSTTAATAPTGLVQGELAVNITDKKLYVGDSVGNSIQIAGAGATNAAGGSNTQVQYNSSGALAGSANMTFDGTTLTAAGFSGPHNGTVGATTPNTGAFTTLSASGAFSANGGATLGDASGDALTINSSAVSIPNGLNFDSNTFVIDATNNRVGIGQASPAARLDLKQASDNWYSGIKLERSAATTQYGFISSAQGTTYVSAVDTAAAGNNVIVFGNSTDGTTLTERMRITSAGNVGIGTSSPSGKLEVAGTDPSSLITRYVNAAGGANIYLQHSRGASVGTNTIVQAGDTLGTIIFSGANGTTFSDAAYIQAQVDNTPGASADMPGRLLFFTSADGSATPTERMRLDSSGNLGLGVTPSASTVKTFEIGAVGNGLVNGGTADIYLAAGGYYNAGWKYALTGTAVASYEVGAGNGSHVWKIAGSGTAGNAITFTQAMTLDASGKLGIGTTSPGGNLDVYGASASIVNSSNNGQLTIGTNTGTSASTVIQGPSYVSFSTYSGSWAERMRIDSSGNLLVGDTTSGTVRLRVTNSASDDIAFFKNSNATPYGVNVSFSGASPNNTTSYFYTCADSGPTTRFKVYSNGGIANYSANNVNLSDARTKTDIVDAGNYLDKICAIPVRTFKYKDQTDDFLNLGVIAQEVEAIAPELVSNDGFGETPEDGVPLKAIYQTDLVYALMKSIQELKAEVDSLKAQLGAK